MKSKWMLTGLMAVALGLAAFGMTGCSKSEREPEQSSSEKMHATGASPVVPASNTASLMQDTNTGLAMPAANTNQAAAEIQPAQAVQYTCSMHPEVVQDKPGRCPKCGMKLVVKK